MQTTVSTPRTFVSPMGSSLHFCPRRRPPLLVFFLRLLSLTITVVGNAVIFVADQHSQVSFVIFSNNVDTKSTIINTNCKETSITTGFEALASHGCVALAVISSTRRRPRTFVPSIFAVVTFVCNVGAFNNTNINKKEFYTPMFFAILRRCR